MKRVEKTWGHELWIENNEKYCGKLLHCEKGKWSSKGKFHYHKEKDETFYVIKGILLIDIEGEEIFLKQGDKLKYNGKRKYT